MAHYIIKGIEEHTAEEALNNLPNEERSYDKEEFKQKIWAKKGFLLAFVTFLNDYCMAAESRGVMFVPTLRSDAATQTDTILLPSTASVELSLEQKADESSSAAPTPAPIVYEYFYRSHKFTLTQAQVDAWKETGIPIVGEENELIRGMHPLWIEKFFFPALEKSKIFDIFLENNLDLEKMTPHQIFRFKYAFIEYTKTTNTLLHLR